MIMTARARRRRHDDAGNITLFVVVMAVAFFGIIGLAVDGAGKVRAMQRADHAAQEAARTAGQQLAASTVMTGGAVALDAARARTAAQAYLKQAGVSGTVTVDGATVTVTTSTTYKPIFVSLLGIGTMTATGSATARTVRGITQEEPA